MLLALLGPVAVLVLSACSAELPSNTRSAPLAVEAVSDQGQSKATVSEATPAEVAASVPNGEGDEALGASGGPGIGARENTLFEALAQHIAALNALNAEDFGSVFLDDCGDPVEAGRLSYSFGAPLVETSGQASNDFESITFLNTDRALVAYATRLPPDIWVVHERRWRISTCPQ